MSLTSFFILLIVLLFWAVWVIMLGDAASRKAEDFRRGSRQLWLGALLLIPVLSGLVWMRPMLADMVFWPLGDLLFSLIWAVARFASWLVLPLFNGLDGSIMWIGAWVISLLAALAYFQLVANRKPTLSGGGLELVTIVLAVNTALLIGIIVILGTGEDAVAAYGGLFEGMIGDKARFAETLVAMTPFVFMGLAVAVGFMTGLFNIGAEGQFYAGALAAAVVGASFTDLPLIIHLPLVLLASMAAGTIWGAIPGFLKARFGAHEVINTIMMNYIAVKTVDYLVKKVVRDPDASLDRTRYVAESAMLPVWVSDTRLHLGFWLAIASVFVVWWVMYKTVWGFEMRTVGANPGAARYAGMSVSRNVVLAMAIGGLLSGLAGAGAVVGPNHNLPAAFSEVLG